jgi:hypothetical protein
MVNLTVIMHLKTYQKKVTLLRPFQTCHGCPLLPDESPHQLEFYFQLEFNVKKIFELLCIS